MKAIIKALGLDELSPSLDINNGAMQYNLKSFPPTDVPFYTESFSDFVLQSHWQPDQWIFEIEQFFLKHKAYFLAPGENDTGYVFHSLLGVSDTKNKAALVGYIVPSEALIVLKFNIGKAFIYLVSQNENCKVWVLFSRVCQIWETMPKYNANTLESVGSGLFMSTNIRFDQMRHHSHLIDREAGIFALTTDYYRKAWIYGEGMKRLREYIVKIDHTHPGAAVEALKAEMDCELFTLTSGQALRTISGGDDAVVDATALRILHILTNFPAIPSAEETDPQRFLLWVSKLISALKVKGQPCSV